MTKQPAFCLFWLLLCCPLLADSTSNLHSAAIKESLEPIRPGVPGKEAFWNEQARQFIWAPAFDFKPVPGAKSYRFVVESTGHTALSFKASEPWAPLTPIWSEVPVGKTALKVVALDGKDKVLGVAGTRQFHRGAVFAGPYGRPLVAYAQSARLALAGLMAEPFVRSWETNGQPAKEYGLYRYASKVIGGLMTGCAMYATQSPRPADADHALEAGRRAAEFLLSVSCPTPPSSSVTTTVTVYAPSSRYV